MHQVEEHDGGAVIRRETPQREERWKETQRGEEEGEIVNYSPCAVGGGLKEEERREGG